MRPRIAKVIFKFLVLSEVSGPNGGVDAAARIQSSIAGRIKLRNTLPPLASNDLLGIVPEQRLIVDDGYHLMFRFKLRNLLRQGVVLFFYI